jgi:endonuclease/exonuclease/phosphatase (EEP) superfamily protein YafD
MPDSLAAMTITSAAAERRATGSARPTRKVALTVLIWLLLVPGLIWAIIRLGGWERGPLVQLFAFTAYVAAWSWIPVLLALGTRRWTAASIAVIAAIGLTAAVLPRALSGNRGPATGVPFTVMTSNMLYGGADPVTIVGLVRDHDVAVLAVQEFTTEGRKALADAGLGDLLPYSSLADEPGAHGSGVYSRFPVTDPGARRNGGGFMQAYATVTVPGAGPVIVESAHPLAPYAVRVLDDWRSDLAAEPRPDRAGPPRVLLGDFNSTLDHTPLRTLIATGYRDAADAAGKGLIPTWPANGRPLPPVTIDHVLADDRLGIRNVTVHKIPQSDHRAVIAALTVPATS